MTCVPSKFCNDIGTLPTCCEKEKGKKKRKEKLCFSGKAPPSMFFTCQWKAVCVGVCVCKFTVSFSCLNLLFNQPDHIPWPQVRFWAVFLKMPGGANQRPHPSKKTAACGTFMGLRLHLLHDFWKSVFKWSMLPLVVGVKGNCSVMRQEHPSNTVILNRANC